MSVLLCYFLFSLSQFGHWQYLIKTAWRRKGLWNKVGTFIKGPGWQPGKPRLGLMEDIPDVRSAFHVSAWYQNVFHKNCWLLHREHYWVEGRVHLLPTTAALLGPWGVQGIAGICWLQTTSAVSTETSLSCYNHMLSRRWPHTLPDLAFWASSKVSTSTTEGLDQHQAIAEMAMLMSSDLEQQVASWAVSIFCQAPSTFIGGFYM